MPTKECGAVPEGTAALSLHHVWPLGTPPCYRSTMQPNITVTLASTSPRRRDLLAQIGVHARVVTSHGDETTISVPDLRAQGVPAASIAPRLARERARIKAAGAHAEPNTIGLLAADTVVECDGIVLGKPRDTEEAITMLTRLGGGDHRVHTAVVFVPHGGKSEDDTRHAVVTSTVTFRTLTTAEIAWHTASEEWRGVAGGYRIQGRAAAFISHLSGSYSAVVGLPIETVSSMLLSFWS